MSRIVFALFIMLGLAVLMHIAIVLLIPRVGTTTFQSVLERTVEENAFSQVRHEELSGGMRTFDDKMLYFACRFAIARADRHVHAAIDTTYWALSFHTPAGETFYTVNNRAGGSEPLDIVLRHAPLAEDGQGRIESGDTGPLVLHTPIARGYVLLRALVPSPSHALAIRQDLAAARCGPAN